MMRRIFGLINNKDEQRVRYANVDETFEDFVKAETGDSEVVFEDPDVIRSIVNSEDRTPAPDGSCGHAVLVNACTRELSSGDVFLYERSGAAGVQFITNYGWCFAEKTSAEFEYPWTPEVVPVEEPLTTTERVYLLFDRDEARVFCHGPCLQIKVRVSLPTTLTFERLVMLSMLLHTESICVYNLCDDDDHSLEIFVENAR